MPISWATFAAADVAGTGDCEGVFWAEFAQRYARVVKLARRTSLARRGAWLGVPISGANFAAADVAGTGNCEGVFWAEFARRYARVVKLARGASLARRGA